MGVRVSILVGVAFFLGCTYEVPEWADCPTYAVPASFDDGQYAAAEEAAIRWNAFAGHDVVHVERAERNTCTLLRTPAEFVIDGVTAQGFNHGSDGRITISDTQNCGDGITADECYVETIMHEMGHGILKTSAHIAPGAGIMSPGLYVTDFTDADRENCRARGICP